MPSFTFAARSYAPAIPIRSGRLSRAPIRLMPIGNPSADRPHGTDTAGSPVMLAGTV